MSDNPEETEYYLRLLSMYMDLGTEIVLLVFVYHSPEKDAEHFLKSNNDLLTKLKRKILNKEEYEMAIKRPPDLKLFDISLLITLSRNMFTKEQFPHPAKGWDQPPENKDKSIGADLLRLRTIRNVIIGHHHAAQMPKYRFDEEWQKVSEILLRIQQKIAPEAEERLRDRIEAYRLQSLSLSTKAKYEPKLRVWYAEVSKIQDQVEELKRKLEGFDVYFKNKCDRYERYIRLLVKGGRFVLSAFLDKEIKNQQRGIRCLLDENKESLLERLTDSKNIDMVYPADSNGSEKSLDIASWEVPVLAAVILHLFASSIGSAVKEAVQMIDDAYKTYVDKARIALDSNTFEDYSSDLKANIKLISNFLDKDEVVKCQQILDDCKQKPTEKDFQTLLEELKTQGSHMKTMTDIYKETLQETKDCLQEMVTQGISFKKPHVLELKMITVGNDEEQKKLAEDILTDVWLEALARCDHSKEFQAVKTQVMKILKEIKMSKSVKNISVQRQCIILQIPCTLPSDMLNLIAYFESDLFYERLGNISNELGYHFNTVFAIYAVLPIDSLHELIQDEVERVGVLLPIAISSPAGVLGIRSLLKSEKITNSTNAIADALSSYLGETITLNVCTDMKELEGVFDGVNASSDGSSDGSGAESSVQEGTDFNWPDIQMTTYQGMMYENSTEEPNIKVRGDPTKEVELAHLEPNYESKTPDSEKSGSGNLSNEEEAVDRFSSVENGTEQLGYAAIKDETKETDAVETETTEEIDHADSADKSKETDFGRNEPSEQIGHADNADTSKETDCLTTEMSQKINHVDKTNKSKEKEADQLLAQIGYSNKADKSKQTGRVRNESSRKTDNIDNVHESTEIDLDRKDESENIYQADNADNSEEKDRVKNRKRHLETRLTESTVVDISDLATERTGTISDLAIGRTGTISEPATGRTGNISYPVTERTGFISDPASGRTGTIFGLATGQTSTYSYPTTARTGTISDLATRRIGLSSDLATGRTGTIPDPATGRTGTIPDPATGRTGTIPDPATGRTGTIPDPATGRTGTIPDPATGRTGTIPDPATGRTGTIPDPATGRTGTIPDPATGRTGTIPDPATGRTGTIPDPATGRTGTIPDPATGRTGTIPDPATGRTGTIPDPATGRTGTIPDPATGRTGTFSYPATRGTDTLSNLDTGRIGFPSDLATKPTSNIGDLSFVQTCIQRFSKDKRPLEFSYWLKTTLGLQITKEGLYELVKYKMKIMIMKFPGDDIHVGKFLRSITSDNFKWTFEPNCGLNWCPLCKGMIDTILENHTGRYSHRINWKCHDGEISPANYWWIFAKIYMTDQNESSTGPEDVDTLSLFNLMINCKLFEDIRYRLQDMIYIRNSLMHSASDRITVTEMKDSFRKMKDLLGEEMVKATSKEKLYELEKLEKQYMVTAKKSWLYHYSKEKAFKLQRKALRNDIKENKRTGQSTDFLKQVLERRNREYIELIEVGCNASLLRVEPTTKEFDIKVPTN